MRTYHPAPPFHSSFAICHFGFVFVRVVSWIVLHPSENERSTKWHDRTRNKSGKKRDEHLPIENGTLSAGCFCPLLQQFSTRIDSLGAGQRQSHLVAQLNHGADNCFKFHWPSGFDILE